MNLLQGKLSYILAGLAVLGGIASWILGLQGQDEAIAMIWGGLALFGVRRAI